MQLETRIARLEMQCRIFRTLFLLAGLALALLIALGAANPAPEVIRAGRFEVIDTAGEIAAVLGHAVGKGGALVLLQSGAMPAGGASSQVFPERGGVFIRGRAGTLLASLGSDDAGNGNLRLHGGNGAAIVNVGADIKDNGHLDLYAARGGKRVAAGVDFLGEGGVEIYSAAKPYFRIGTLWLER